MISDIVSIEEINGKPAWKCTLAMHLTGEQNQGRHNVFIWVIKNNQIVRDGSILVVWGWVGQKSDEPSPSYKCDKQLSTEPSTDIPIFDGMQMWIKVSDRFDTKSDIVHNLRTDLGGINGNSSGHHSFNVVFKYTDDNITTTPEPELTWQDAYKALDARIKKLEEK